MSRLYSREVSVSPEEYPGQGGDPGTSVATNLTSPEAGHRSSDRGSKPWQGGATYGGYNSQLVAGCFVKATWHMTYAIMNDTV